VNEPGERREVEKLMQGPPSGYFVVVPGQSPHDDFDVATLIGVALRGWKIVLGAVLVAAVVAAIISLQMRKTYRAQALIAPVAQNSGGAMNALRSEFGGLAALAGIDLGSSSGRQEEALATLSSTGLAREFIKEEKLLPTLYDEQWDEKRKAWREGEAPTLEDAVQRFTGQVRTVDEDLKTGLVTVTVEWYSPELAAGWANRLVDRTNERLRSDAIRNSERSIEFLEKELAKTNVVELRQAIYRLIETQVNSAMLANVQREYAFRFIDRAVPPEQRASPRRKVIVAAGGAIGLMLGLGFVLVNHAIRRARASRLMTEGAADRA
jgi:uncharacterized protein involved in exopolysaccharide biosynthesis